MASLSETAEDVAIYGEMTLANRRLIILERANMSDEQNKEISFEESLSKLEKIVNDMESKKLSLDDMMKAYEEGKTLATLCTEKLSAYEKKIELLVKGTENNPEWKEFRN